MAITLRLVDPHIDFYVRAICQAATEGTPPEVPTQQELRVSHDLGLYTVEELEDLLGELCTTLTEWVENHPPYEPEPEPEPEPEE